ncbi:ABC transporter ATP-binding protein [Bifidobacterium simiarum]|uniref:DUF3099 domain-containing protein n=1 Tax=Bifidobacterium simiarum TaxID=2045441 RepID=A0A2M9HDY6_9BIFI|nr:ABC transporter ATP-binding protein [Bifidobacterium simiarum]PJM75019.1 hypothetical protein CSQ87_07280 [Bifidobacterium simiarum]
MANDTNGTDGTGEISGTGDTSVTETGSGIEYDIASDRPDRVADAGTTARRRRQAVAQIVFALVLAVGLVLAAGLLYDWRLALLLIVMMVPAVLATVVIHRHPERTGGRSAFGITDASTLLRPFAGGRTDPKVADPQGDDANSPRM